MSAATPLADSDTPRLIDLLLEEQQSLRAVERFSEHHDAAEPSRQSRFYRDLIPASAPGPGRQYAFRVDLDACTGCKSCVTACHSLNGLDETETWRDVGLLLGGSALEPRLQTVTTACHHCEDPACLAGCPVQAYEKDPLTGIVRHLDDQCIGCQYCVLKCPYDVPRYSEARGIVRKCDMCGDRLAAAEAPACVQGCPTQAIEIDIIDRAVPGPATLLGIAPGAMPASDYTRPTTRYVGRHTDALLLRPADAASVEPADPHTPLAVMLVLLQGALGLLIGDALLGALATGAAPLRPVWSAAAALLASAGLAAATLHLGRPQYAFRAFLGWRTSWMSREILVLGPFAALAAVYAASFWAAPVFLAGEVAANRIAAVRPALSLAACALGALGVYCSIMIYADTRRPFWALHLTAFRFVGSTLVLGPAALLACGLVAAATSGEAAAIAAGIAAPLAAATAVAAAAKLLGETTALRRWGANPTTPLFRSVRLLRGELRSQARARGFATIAAIACAFAAGGLALRGAPVPAAFAAIAALALAGLGELLERHLFFRAEAARAMPGAG